MLVVCITLLCVGFTAQAQVTGKLVDENGDPLIGANIVVEGTFVGTTTNLNGEFTIRPDFSKGQVTLVISSVGYRPQRIQVQQGQRVELQLEVATTMADEIIISASRVEEAVMETPVTIEKVGIKQLETQASTELYSSLARFKGIDVNQSSLLITSLSTRGFNSAKSERLIQMVDYVDFMSPSLSLYAGNLGGIPEIDIESVDIIHGANSSLYGTNAFNGVVITNSKDPFKYEGATVLVRGGERNLFETQIRVAKKITDRFAIKLIGSYYTATDFIGDFTTARNRRIVPTNNPEGSVLGYDAMHRHGNLAIVNPNTAVPGAPPGTTVGALGFQGTVFTPGFREADLVGGEDFKATSSRIGASLHYLITDKIQVNYQYRYGEGSGIYQSSNRYAWERLQFNYHKLEVKSDKWFVRAYRNEDRPGTTYDLAFLATGMQAEQPYRPGASPSPVEGLIFPALSAALGGAQNVTYAAMYQQTWAAAFASARSQGQTVDQASAFAQQQTANILPANSSDPRFAIARDGARNNPRNFDPSFTNNSWFWDFSGQYQLPIEFMKVLVGGSYRTFTLTSRGTLFGDADNSPIGSEVRNQIPNYEYGAYAQLQKSFIEDRLKLNFSGRVDAFQNFDTRFSPRFSAVYSVGADRQHNFRASYAQAFRAPAQVDQYIYLDIGQLLLLGNIGENPARGFTGIPLTQIPTGNFNTTFIRPLELEQMNTWEIGYKGILFKGFYIDLSYYRSDYTNFIGTTRFVGREDGTAPSIAEFVAIQANPALAATAGRNRSRAMQVWLNSDVPVTSQGFQVGVEYYINKAFNIATNYTWATINDVPGLILGFNTPEHKVNFGVNGEPFKRFTYNVNARWIDNYNYFMPFDEGRIESFTTVDVQFNYRVPKWYTTFRAGATNLFDAQAIQVYGSAPIGRISYVGAVFDLNFK